METIISQGTTVHLDAKSIWLSLPMSFSQWIKLSSHLLIYKFCIFHVGFELMLLLFVNFQALEEVR